MFGSNSVRQFSVLDRIIIEMDRGLRAMTGAVRVSARPCPRAQQPTQRLSQQARARSIGYMRVNHVGEVCAQALYFGQAWVTRDAAVSKFLLHSATEEADHLAWCHQRICALNGRISWLNPVWYGGSFILGAVAGASGLQWGLGFIAETEHQVGMHLKSHLKKLPAHDHASRAIVQQMVQDEAEHCREAQHLGAKPLPSFIAHAMRMCAKGMTTVAYWI